MQKIRKGDTVIVTTGRDKRASAVKWFASQRAPCSSPASIRSNAMCVEPHEE